jgi:hypothetical protein
MLFWTVERLEKMIGRARKHENCKEILKGQVNGTGSKVRQRK